MNVRIDATAAACVLAMLAGSATAQGSERQWRAACTRDAFVHCTHQALAADRAGVRDCLVQSIDRISAPCRAVIHTAMGDGLRTGAQSRGAGEP